MKTSGTRAQTNPSAKERTRFFARVFLGISLSILLHVVVSIATYKASDFYAKKTMDASKATLIEWVDPDSLPRFDRPEQQVVRQTELPPEALALEDTKSKRRFLSQERQTVKQESQAAASGLTENRSNQSPSQASTSSQAGPRTKLPEVRPENILDQTGADLFAHGEALAAPTRMQQNGLLMPGDPRRKRGFSTNGERLPDDIQIGDFTALNTDRFVYYTYYARIEEQIRHRWVRYVKAAIYGGGDLPSGRRDFKTQLEIVLNRSGEFVRAIIHEGSGSRDIDAAPILAFREAQRIPHPPREMVKDDGTIRLHYSFHVDQLPPLARGNQTSE
ncbi:MAG: TonB C-terminal domain-containing protein [Bdellovibrionales bacterium]|nr:TonB C-terminal domain-containing protein [Bdellovibrionales bacterium]